MYFISVWTPGRVAATKVVANGDPNKHKHKHKYIIGLINDVSNK